MTNAMAGSPPADLLKPFPWDRPPVDPPPTYAWLRENHPIHRVMSNDGTPVWLVTRYDDVRAILSDPRVSADWSRPGFPFLGAPPPSDHRPFIRMDPPDHTIYRRLFTRHFTPRRLAELRPRVQELVDQTLDEVLAAPNRQADFVHSFALPVPSTVLSWMLGVPESDRAYFNEAAAKLMRTFTDPEYGRTVRTELNNYIGTMLDVRAASGEVKDDFLSDLVAAMQAGTMQRHEALANGTMLLVAGHETTANMTAMSLATLLQHPEQLAELRADPGLLRGAIEELLRYLTIVHLIISRIATEDISIGGVTIRAGEAIVPLNLAANRDDAHYDRADELDIHRDARDHVAFGFGVHQCLGQPLARLELQVILETLLRRVPSLRLAHQPATSAYRSASMINGLYELQLAW